MSGEKNLSRLLSTMSPALRDGKFVFVSLQNPKPDFLASLKPLATFYENEGCSLILQQGLAEQNQIDYVGIYSCITLMVHSSLEAVGLTAAVSSKLTERNISANVVAAFYHDHVFVALADTQQALTCLKELSEENA